MNARHSGSIFPAILLTVFICLIALGCGGGNPVSPGADMSIQPGANASAANGATGHMLWGMWEISVDPVGHQAEALPLRGAMFNANVVKFLQPPSAPIHLLTVKVNPGSDFATGHLDLDITLRHPFVGLQMYRGFDVKGIVMGGGSFPFSFDPTVLRAGPMDLQLENPDGWTRWWNPTEFTTYDTILGYTHGAKAPSTYYASATINPYKYFADGLDKDAPLADVDILNRGSFSTAPGINTRHYILQFPQTPGGIKYWFNYAVDASWALPDPAYEPDYPPEAYPPEANTQEAWQASIDDTGTTAWFVNDSAKGGKVKLSVEVFDWQGATDSNGVADEVSAILVDCPLFMGPFDLKAIGSVSPAGPASSVWTAEITDITLISAGSFECWIAVQADSPDNYAPQIQGDPNKFAWPDAPLRSYWRGTVEVSPFFPSNAPEVHSVNPSQGTQSTVLTDVEIAGSGFQNGATVEFAYDPSNLLSVTSVVVVDDGLITCDLGCYGPLGFYDVTVTNPDTQEGTLDDGFEVIKPSTEQIWWQSHMYNVENIGQNPTVPGADPETLQVKWTSPVSGDKKYCTPVVADGKIYFTGNDGFYANTSQTVYCFDLYTGGLLWSHPINPDGTGSGRAFSAPVWWAGSDNMNRLAVGGEKIYCYDADSGDELWNFDGTAGGADTDWVSNQLQEYQGMLLARARQAALFVIDFATGDLIHQIDCISGTEGGCGAKDGKVYISSSYYLQCADIQSGQMLWSTFLPNQAQITHWINPTLVGDRCYVSTYQGYVFCVATVDDGTHKPGDIIWSWNDPNIIAGANPLVGGTSAVRIGGVTRLFVAAAFDYNYVYCIEDLGETGATLWQSDKTGYFDSSPVWSSAPSYPEGVVYAPDREGNIDAFDASNGHCIWSPSVGTELRAGMSPILDMLVVTSGTDVTVYEAP